MIKHVYISMAQFVIGKHTSACIRLNVNPCINIGLKVMRPQRVMETRDEAKLINGRNNNRCDMYGDDDLYK